MLGKISISESNGRNSTRSLAIISQTEVCAIVRISIHNFITEYFPQPADLINIRWCWFLDWRDTTNGLLPLQNYYLFIAGCVWMSVSSRAHLLGELVWKMVCRGFFFSWPHKPTNYVWVMQMWIQSRDPQRLQQTMCVLINILLLCDET